MANRGGVGIMLVRVLEEGPGTDSLRQADDRVDRVWRREDAGHDNIRPAIEQRFFGCRRSRLLFARHRVAAYEMHVTRQDLVCPTQHLPLGAGGIGHYSAFAEMRRHLLEHATNAEDG